MSLRTSLLAVAIAASLPACAWAGSTLRYVALVDGGKQAGHQVVETADDGSVSVDFIFKDNGRGPELKERYTLAPDGTFATYEVKGATTFGSKVDERFSREGATVRWRSTSDEGTARIEGPALYTALGGTPQGMSVALAALAKRPDGTLPLIPGGTLRARELARETVTREGRTQDVVLKAITGVGLTPNFVWSTTGASPRVFAFIVPGYLQLVEDGWQANAATLEERQKTAERELLVDMRKRLGQPLGGATMVRNARVFDSAAAALGAASDVLIRDGRIVSVTATGLADPAPGTRVIDAGGRVMLPGLFDMHGHIDAWQGPLELATGVTTVRDMGNDNATLGELIAEADAGRLIAPRVVKAGFIEGESPYSARNGFVVKDLAEAKKAIDWYAANGYIQLKVYNSFPKAILKDTVAYAHGKGLRVSGHVPAFLRADDVVDAGFDEIQHINQLLLNFFVDETTDTRTLKRFYLVADKTADLDLDSKPVQDFIARLASKKVAVDPTLATFEFLHQEAGELSPIVADVVDHLPPDIQRNRRAAELDIPDKKTAERYDRSFAKLVEFVGRMHKAGITIVPGTDEMPGFTLQRELALYVQAGMTPGEALRSATHTAATVARVGDDRGHIVAGQRADFLLVDGDPTTDIGDIRKVALVVQGDTAYSPSALHESLGIRPFVPSIALPAAP